MNNTLPLRIEEQGDNKNCRYVVITAQDNHYASTYDPQAARMIKAGPDLLEAARMASNVLQHLKEFLPEVSGPEIDRYKLAIRTIGYLEDAITKADGTQS